MFHSPYRLKISALTSVIAGLALSLTALNPSLAADSKSPAPNDASVYFISPNEKEVLTSPVTIRFGLKRMGIAPAGINFPSTGHHHLLINREVPVDFEKPLPSTSKTLHFGKGQTEVSLELPPGKHRLQLLLGDHLHRPHDPPILSEPLLITIRSEPGTGQ